ncbi:MAG: lipopolysaccharide heptosyltransferase I [Endozoicomonadaceae bacterium]|nr:lipopolysaccharide heptosyltransferase I [Endozoicomonadaceae bacterium]
MSVQQNLIIKTTSLGDVVHMLPAITDAATQYPELRFDWVVERGFSEVPTWHPQIDNVIPVAIRQWRKSLFAKNTRQEITTFKAQLQEKTYNNVIDSQGLLKSALLTRWAKGKVWGYDKKSIREPIASFLYANKVSVLFTLHAITRNRLILAKILGYSIDDLPLDYGIAKQQNFALPADTTLPEHYIVALHGTSRVDKEWPIETWHQFIPAMEKAGYTVFLPWGNEREHQRAQTLATKHQMTQVLPKCSLGELAGLLQKASAVIGMDTGLMHIAAALNKKGIALYPVTQPILTGVLSGGEQQTIESIGGNEALNTKQIVHKMLTLLPSL